MMFRLWSLQHWVYFRTQHNIKSSHYCLCQTPSALINRCVLGLLWDLNRNCTTVLSQVLFLAWCENHLCYKEWKKNPKQKTPGCVFEKKLWKIHQYLQLQWQLLLCEQSGMKAAFPWIPYPFSPLCPIPTTVTVPALPSSAPRSCVFPVPPCTLQQPHCNLPCWSHSLNTSWAEGTGIPWLQAEGSMVWVSRMANPPSLDLPSLISRNFEELDVTESSWHWSDLVQADRGLQRH